MTTSYEVLGSTVTIPVEVRDARSWFSTFAVPLDAARELIAYSGLEPVAFLPGRAMCSLAFVRYVEGDLGPYHEVAVALVVHRPGSTDRKEAGAFIHRLPVNQEFTCAAGRGIWGFPKVVTDIAIDEGRRRDTCELYLDGVRALRISIAHGVPTPMRDTALDAYSCTDGVLRRTEWTLDGEGSRGRPGGVTMELGDHPFADELRSLGMPRRALMSGSMRQVRMRFGEAEVLATDLPLAGVR